MKLEKFRITYHIIEELKKISRKLHYLDTKNCNTGLNEREEKRIKKLEQEAKRLAKCINLKVYHQRDPRGATLYVIESGMEYCKGVAI